MFQVFFYPGPPSVANWGDYLCCNWADSQADEPTNIRSEQQSEQRMIISLYFYQRGCTKSLLWTNLSCAVESRLEGVDRRNLKFTNLSTHYKSGLALELNPSPIEKENKSTKK
jgi:hypothetical protein